MPLPYLNSEDHRSMRRADVGVHEVLIHLGIVPQADSRRGASAEEKSLAKWYEGPK